MCVHLLPRLNHFVTMWTLNNLQTCFDSKLYFSDVLTSLIIFHILIYPYLFLIFHIIPEMSKKRERSSSRSPPASSLPWMRVGRPPSLLSSMCSGPPRSPLLQRTALVTQERPALLTTGESNRLDLANIVRLDI